jgi:hypothetical protein
MMMCNQYQRRIMIIVPAEDRTSSAHRWQNDQIAESDA